MSQHQGAKSLSERGLVQIIKVKAKHFGGISAQCGFSSLSTVADVQAGCFASSKAREVQAAPRMPIKATWTRKLFLDGLGGVGDLAGFLIMLQAKIPPAHQPA